MIPRPIAPSTPYSLMLVTVVCVWGSDSLALFFGAKGLAAPEAERTTLAASS